jgi:mersacidin/lichenicidin family type 2 lantibiotic
MTIRAWKDAEYRASLSPEQLALLTPSPAGESLQSDELNQQVGGIWYGWVLSISGECNGGTCCNPFGSGN